MRLSTGDELNNLPMPTVEVEVYHVWWEFDTDTFPPLSLLTFPHHGGILSFKLRLNILGNTCKRPEMLVRLDVRPNVLEFQDV